jgi:TRAP-type C4-dicarboxylate transport system substrate-binding protein
VAFLCRIRSCTKIRPYYHREFILIDAAENTWTSYIGSGDYEVAKFCSLTEHSMAPEVLLFSKTNWDRLSKGEQGIIRAAAKESVPYMRTLWDAREVSARKAIIDAGAQFVTDVDKQSFSDAMRPVRMMLLADPKLRDMVDRVEATE